LIVDDEPLVLSLLTRVLTEAGYNTLTCDDGSAALALIAGHRGTVDVVLTDIRMPGVTGWTVGAAAKARWPWAGIVYMSGHCRAPDNVGVRIAPDDCFIQKPFDALTLLAAVAHVCCCESVNVA
jgi:DNA-binding response OmpR family regulator